MIFQKNKEQKRINQGTYRMENTSVLDAIAGALGLAILIGGLVMLFKGMSAFQEKE